MTILAELTQDGFITRAAILWNKGMDTKQIALQIGSTESEVYNRMDLVKARAERLAR